MIPSALTERIIPDVDVIRIIAPGPSLAHTIAEIEAGDYVIAVNYAITAPCHADAWMVADARAHEADWWHTAHRASLRKHTTRIFSDTLISNCDSLPSYSFHQGSAMGYADTFPREFELRCNGTVVAQALQWIYWQCVGVYFPKVIIHGMDMAGNGYYDGTQAYTDRDGEWPYVEIMDNLRATLAAQGMITERIT